MALDKIKTDIITDDAITVAKMHTDTGVQPDHHRVPVYANNSARDSAISSPANGMIIYNTAETAIQQYNGTWSTLAPAPTINSISGTINEDTNTTLTVNGSQYVSGMTIKLVLASNGSDVSGHTSLSYSLVSSAQITVTIPSGTTGITAGTVVQLEIIKSGLSVRSSTITVSEDPNWSTSAGTFATISDLLGSSQTVGTLSASAGAGGGTIVYASDDSSLNTTYFSLNTSTGAITTTSTALTGLTGSGNFTESFNANAKIQGSESSKNTLLSGINIIVNVSLDGASSARAAVSCQAIMDLTSTTTSGTYWIYADTNVAAAQHYCDMSTHSGIGWTLVGTRASNTKLGQGSSDDNTSSYGTDLSTMGQSISGSGADNVYKGDWKEFGSWTKAWQQIGPVDSNQQGRPRHNFYFENIDNDTERTFFGDHLVHKQAYNISNDTHLDCRKFISAEGQPGSGGTVVGDCGSVGYDGWTSDPGVGWCWWHHNSNHPGSGDCGSAGYTDGHRGNAWIGG